MLDVAVSVVFDAEVAWHSEVNPAAAAILEYQCPGVPNLGDITAVNWNAVESVDILCGGFPCFPAGTLIDAGEDGLRPIETLRVGDMVLTHERRRRAVTSVMRREADDVLSVKAMGAPEFRTTSEHPFYVLRSRDAIKPEWVAAGELRKGDYFAMPLDEASDQSVLGADLAYVVGRWLGDGWIVDHKRTSSIVGKRGSRVNSRIHKAIICCAHDEADELAAAITKAGLHATRASERTVVKFHISSQEFVKTLRPFGRGAAGKHLPGWVFTAPQDERAALLQGWLNADGCYTQGAWKATTVSEQLAHGMGRLARSVHQRAVSVHRAEVPATTVIEGRTVNQRTQYQVVIPERNKVAFVRDGFVWVPLRSVTEAEPCEVFNVSVDEDESYTAWGYTVHNCQDVSCAGRRAGLGEGTRSGLWSYFAYAIAVLKPSIVVIENVRGLLSAKAKMEVPSGEEDDAPDDVERQTDDVGVLRAAGAVLGDLSDLGYDAQWTTLAASAVGAPHKRERVFILATRRNALSDTADGGLGGAADARGQSGEGLRAGPEGRGGSRGADVAADTESGRWSEGQPEPARVEGRSDAGTSGDSADARSEPAADAGGDRCEGNEKLDGSSLSGVDSEQWRHPDRRAVEGGGGERPLPDSGGADARRANGVTLLPGVVRELLPTPRVSADRTSHSAATRPNSRSGPSLEQALEIAKGELPREFNSFDEVPQSWQLLPTPTVQDSKNNGGPAQHERNTPPLNAVATLLPTTQARDWKGGMSNQFDINDAVKLLPTPKARQRSDCPGEHRRNDPDLGAVTYHFPEEKPVAEQQVDWGKYADAVERWENVTRPAPPPTEPNTKGNPRLAPAFAEWMMGWPDGWVTDPAIGLSRNDQLKAIGNGVVPHQAIAALRSLLPHSGIVLTHAE